MLPVGWRPIQRMKVPPRIPDPTEVSDENWAFLASSLRLMHEAEPQRRSPIREHFNGLRYIRSAVRSLSSISQA